MPAFTVGTYPWTVGAVIALIVILLAILGLLNVIPLSATVVFGLLAALGVARLL
jgi:uncharacterized membrane protein YgaE (UPF0421/DUF939 family)